MAIQNSIIVNLMGAEHVVSYPSVGQKLQIESAKILFSNGTYSQLAVSVHKTAEDLLDIIDAYSYFSVMIPGIRKAFTTETLGKLDILAANELRKEFRKYYDFYVKFETEMLNQITDTHGEKDTIGTEQSTEL